MPMLRKAALVALAAGLAGMAACSPVSSYQGFQAIDQRPADVKVGQDTRSSVLAKLGSPTATSTFDKDIWFYLSQIRTQTSFYSPRIISRNVVAIAFDHDTQQVKSVDTYTLADGRVIAYNTRETPTRGREMTILEQMIGSIGAGSVLPPDSNITPGSHPGDQH
jgi:outer membrane protein assembly factor BamE (lipoprotein component of BamABCDE complex)